MWFRRDLRLADLPALVEAARRGPVVGLFVLDPVLLGSSGVPRAAFLMGSLRSLDASMDHRLWVLDGDPIEVVPALAEAVHADEVHVTEDFGPYGHRRDERVADALASRGRRLVRTGTPYAVAPGLVLTGGGTPYRVFTPFSRAWAALGWADPVAAPAVDWVVPPSGSTTARLPAVDCPAALPAPGEAAAWARAEAFLAEPVHDYAELRNRPDVDGTSRLSPYLRWGCLHPRQLLGRLAGGKGPEVFRSELAWREFYADVLWHEPRSAWESLQPKAAKLPSDEGPEADRRFEAWTAGRTGFPIVDAGMRQLAAEGWMHNRVRMIVASFLVKDLHLPWPRGARYFMDHLVDGDLASNQHGWQWTAGTGTDAAPYLRVFNPTAQGARFDPDGTYVRRYVPELAHVAAKDVHEPSASRLGLPLGYPPPMVDHAVERAEALRRWSALG